jgi:hypothetical protein
MAAEEHCRHRAIRVFAHAGVTVYPSHGSRPGKFRVVPFEACAVKLFDFDPASLAEAYRTQQWVHVSGGTTAEFSDHLAHEVAAFRDARGIERDGISVAKEQFVLELDDHGEMLHQVFDMVGELCGLRRGRLTLSERHLNIYSPDAAPMPRPHKDRLASQVSVGVAVDIPEGSHLVLWPDVANATNRLQRAGLAESLEPADSPEVALAGAPPVNIFDTRGDVQVFAGSRIWHTRRNPGNAAVLYFKCNDFGSDPLGEDPRSVGVRQQSTAFLERVDDFVNAHAVRARGFESVTREDPLDSAESWLNVNVWGRPPMRINACELELLVELAEPMRVSALVREESQREQGLRRLVSLGAVDLHRDVDA